MAAALGFMACSEDDISVEDNRAEGDSPKGMVLRATVEQTAASRATVEQTAASRATISDAWLFDFATGDKVSVTNTEVTAGTYYTFTNGGTQFTSADAKPTASAATWYAYFPSSTIDLTGQSGTRAAVANTYALAGATAEATTGEDGLSITLAPQVAILVIDNQKGTIDINVKNSASTWVSGLKASTAGFTVTDATEKQTLLSATNVGTYYVAVPAGVQLAVKDGDKVIKSTKEEGLAAGSYYNLTLAAPFGQGVAKATIDGEETSVKWIQLWADGPKFAEYNVGVTDGLAESLGGHYTWGGTFSNGEGMEWNDRYSTSKVALSGNEDTATALWGSNWRMPRQDELLALLKLCTCKWTADYNETGVKGLLCTGTGDYAANSVFLPAACSVANNDGTGNLQDGMDGGFYWSSTPDDFDNAAECLAFINFGFSLSKDVGNWSLSDALSVRAVLNETPATTGVSKAKINGVDTDVHWVQLWADGPKFAEYNIGSTSPLEYGGYYTWGGTYENGETIDWRDDHNTGSIDLAGEYDTATALWGSSWRMPTSAEYEALLDADNCDMQIVHDGEGGIAGAMFQGKEGTIYASNHMFLRAAGYCNNLVSPSDAGYACGAYWCSTLDDSEYPEMMTFEQSGAAVKESARNNGFSVRSVLAE